MKIGHILYSGKDENIFKAGVLKKIKLFNNEKFRI
jgi:hypothetical protein